MHRVTKLAEDLKKASGSDGAVLLTECACVSMSEMHVIRPTLSARLRTAGSNENMHIYVHVYMNEIFTHI